MPHTSHPTVPLVATLLGLAAPALAAEADLRREFSATVRPFLERYCTDCHGKDKPKGQLDLTGFASMDDVTRGHKQWESVLEMLAAREMPPEKAKKQPTDEERTRIAAWGHALRRHEAERHAGDPGPVLARRLSNAEYDYTIRDLTGVDLRPTREFPVDPANEAGFDNSGESLAMSPALLKKYLAAARSVAENLVLLPDGFRFAGHPMLSETDRDKYAVLRIIDFYQRQPTDLAAYFRAAWRFQHRAARGQPAATLAACAAEEKVSPKYLATVWSALAEAREDVGPMARLQAMWRKLPAPASATAAPPRAETDEMRDWVVRLRDKLAPRFKNLQLKAVATGAQPFILWKNTQYATHRTTCNQDALYDAGDPARKAAWERRAEAARAVGLQRAFLASLAPQSDTIAALGPALGDVHDLLRKAADRDADLAIPADPGARERHLAGFTRFCQVFPDAFFVSERGRMHLDRPKEKQDKGRFLSAGYHNMMGYFRDDLPLYQLVLDAEGQRALDTLWRELDFVTLAPTRQHADFIFYERAEPPRTIKGPEFDFIRSEDKASASEAMIKRLAKVYVAKARDSLAKEGGDAISIPVLEKYFEDVNANIRRLERDKLAAEPRHLEALVAFAQRAYRRPLQRAERDGLLAFYRSLRRAHHLDHEEALRDAVASVLVSPHFAYRIDLLETGKSPRGTATVLPAGARPLPQYALASRLSYFLWSSMPDAELLARAAAGELDRPEVLAAQARRMLRDERARALAVEFGGNWLDFRRFEEHNGVDRERFPGFDNELRQAMFEEPVRFFLDVAREDRSVLDFVYGQHTFVNRALAKHYGMPAPVSDGWVRIEDAQRYQRGGILPMAVFLTKNAPGLRTSPVKRGYWVVRRALGEQIPAPPAQVPDLPNDERKMGNITLRDALARHREDKACAGCHARFDSFGLVFEGYGPVGELRSKDLGGRPVDTRAQFPGGSEGAGVEGLRAYVRAHRQDDFLENLSRKLLSYALGRSLILSDDATVREMRSKLAAGGHRFGSLIETIVQSPQFRFKRGQDRLAQRGN